MAAAACPTDGSKAMADRVEARLPKRQTSSSAEGPEAVKARALATGDTALKLPFGRKAKGHDLKDLLLASNCRAASKLLAKRYPAGLPSKKHELLFNALNVENNGKTKSVKLSIGSPSTPRTESTEASSADAGLQATAFRRFSTEFSEVRQVRSSGFGRSVTEPSAVPQAAATQASNDNAPMVRNSLLGFRFLHAEAERPEELRTFSVVEVQAPERASFQRQHSSGMPARQLSSGMGPLARQMSSQSQATPRTNDARSSFGLRREGLSGRTSSFNREAEPFEMLTPSSKAYQARNVSSPSTRLDDLRRSVQGCLNKICPENIGTISETLTGLGVRDSTELEAVIELIFKKALTEPHYCETYADLVFTLKQTFPEFPSPDGGRPITFRSSILNICQAEFEALPKALDMPEEEKAGLDDEEISALRKRKKDRVLANMKFIGHLFLRQLLSTKVIGSVLRELVLCGNLEEFPEEHAIECACELLMSIGYTLDTLPAGPNAIQQVCGRLLELKKAKRSDGRDAYCKRVQFLLQDLLDTRAAGWTKKLFRTSAKTKGEIRTEQQRDLIAKEQGADMTGGEMVIAGQRPIYMTAVVGG